ncbi:MAG: endonuclease/exonuclease/phosphatase family protein [Bacteroidales bacterium]|nr:endonuclease/exonuclease/phosphatase family protein [Bacteroidales bacterium]
MVFKLTNGNYGGAVVLTTDNNPQTAYNLVATTRLNESNKPTLKGFENAEVLVCNFGQWRDKADVTWYMPDLFYKDYADIYENIGKIAVNLEYDTKNHDGKGYLFKPSWTTAKTLADSRTIIHRMKIITWNCNMAFRKKAEFILTENPDILIVPECENRKRLSFGLYTKPPTDIFGYGNNPHKGIGIFSFSDFKIRLLDIHNPDFRFVLPLSVYNNKINLTVFAIWSQKPENHDCYTERVWNAVHFYSNLLDCDNVILAGDLNSNSIWDNPNIVYNHANLVNYLKSKNIFSTYHHFHNQTQGQEKDNTLFMYRKRDRPYHIDFCFASLNLIGKLENVEVGSYEKWIKYSDHTPLIVTFGL